MDYIKDVNNLKIIIVVVISLAIFFIFFNKKKENFENPTNALEKRMSEEEIIIRPPYIRPDTRTIMSGSGFIPQKEVIPAWGEQDGVSDDLDDGEGGNYGLHYNLCSPSCCSEQWPTPHKLQKDRFVCGSKDQYVPNRYTCTNSFMNAGCLCMTKKQANFLGSRGGNA